MAGHLWGLIQDHIDSQRYPVSERQIAKALGMAPQALTKWKHPVGLLKHDSLVAISRLTGAPYRDVLDAALRDIGYLPREDGEWDERPAATKQAGASPADDVPEVVTAESPELPGPRRGANERRPPEPPR